jgi:hypothetical protein
MHNQTVNYFIALSYCVASLRCPVDAWTVAPSTSLTTRRDALLKGASVTASLLTVAPTLIAAAENPNTTTEAASSMAQVGELLNRLKGIPAFCIVSPQGAAYMVFKSDQAMAVGYAFITFQGALAVLGDAQRNAKEKGFFDVWENATITTIPLDIAVRLALKQKQRKSQKDQVLNSMVFVIPGAVRFCPI